MVLDSIGAGLLDQDDLYADERNNTRESSSWHNPPDGPRWVMNDLITQIVKISVYLFGILTNKEDYYATR